MGTYLIDSNVLIDYIGKKFDSVAEEKLDAVFNTSFNYSVISKIEVLGFNASAGTLQGIESFLQMGEVHYLNEQICQQTITVRRSLLKSKLPDLIIAATALVGDYTLLTRNTDDFKNIGGLKMINPWSWSSSVLK